MGFWDVILHIFLALLGAAFFGVIGILIFIGIRAAVTKKTEPPKSINAIYICLCVVIFLWFGAKFWYGSHKIGSFFECENYQDELYYAYLYPEDDDIKNYKIVLKLDREDAKYIPDTVYFNQRQYFDVYLFADDSLEVDEQILVEDNEGRRWNLELSSQMADRIPQE